MADESEDTSFEEGSVFLKQKSTTASLTEKMEAVNELAEEKMNMANLRKIEYDVQLFGFTVEDFIIAFQCLFEDEVSRLASLMASSLIKRYPDGDPEIKVIIDFQNKLIRHYKLLAQKPLDIFRKQLKELLHIPPHVLLPEDVSQRTQYSAEEEQEIDNQLKNLLQRMQRAKAFKVELQQELKMLQEILPGLNKRVEDMENIVSLQQKKETILIKLEPTLETKANSTTEMLQLENILDQRLSG